MSFISNTLKEINLKVVYFGPGLSGKTTNLNYIHKNSDAETIGQLVELNDKNKRTAFFDFLPLKLGKLGGFTTNLHLFTIPGYLAYETNRKILMKGVDGVVFVADSKKTQRKSNKEFLNNLSDLLYDQGLEIGNIPFVFQYNHTDSKDSLPLEELSAELNIYNKEEFSAIANQGTGVFETLESISKQILDKLKEG